jgi:isopenicillin N synthase-like dioxygenase
MRSVPVVDLDALHRPDALAALDAACRDWGIFHVVGHGIAQATTTGLLDAMRAFFTQPAQIKRAISRTATNPWGYYDRELTKNTPDWKEIWDYGPPDSSGTGASPQWPDGVSGFRETVLAFYSACENLSLELLGAIAKALHVDAKPLVDAFRPSHTSFLRLNHYPVCAAPERPDTIATPSHGHLGVNHHTDAGAITVLLQDQHPGLEVHRAGAWWLVEPLAGALTVNLGDVLQVWTNDRYVAPLHRVLASGSFQRYSAPFFLNPDYATTYAPLAPLLDATHPARYRPINWGEFRAGRAAGDYADVGEEIQIGHYAIGSHAIGPGEPPTG